MEDQEWEVIEKQKVLDKYIAPTLFVDGAVYYKVEYIIKNKKTGEIRRV